MPVDSGPEIVRRIQNALQAAAESISSFIPGNVVPEFKAGDDPITEADRTANRILRQALKRHGEGWLSEESLDDLSRLQNDRVWVVDPLDGTREFVAGIPEWCISVALVENGKAVAGGVYNPTTRELFLGAVGQGITLNGRPVRPTNRRNLLNAVVLASRSEVKRGEWNRFSHAPFVTKTLGSVAYKLALVAAGLADATWTFAAKSEWDIAAGVALIECAGGIIRSIDNSPIRFNQRTTRMPGLLACGPHLSRELIGLLAQFRTQERLNGAVR
ncbi:MAG: 3'(2'),5'-bisphosphate nucleotidase CysQ [Candidatus Acidiferrales bacterium]